MALSIIALSIIVPYLTKKSNKITTPLKRDMDYNGNCI
jgi:hypothetical protein